MKWIYFFLTIILFSCDDQSTTQDQSNNLAPSKDFNIIERKEYAIKKAYGKETKSELVYHYKEIFNDQNLLIKSITVFGYDELKDTTDFLYDTVHFHGVKKKDRTNYYLEGILSEVEIQEDTITKIYQVEDPEVPMIIRQYDRNKNLLLEVTTDADLIFVQRFSPTQKIKNRITTATADYFEYRYSDEVDIELLDFSGLELLYHTKSIAEFSYE